MTNKQALRNIKFLLNAYKQGKIATLAQHEVNPGLEKGSRENYLYFTLPVCINFQRNSPAMWQAALKTWKDPETNYLFFPEKLANNPYEKIQTDLVKHKLALQRNKHTQIWTGIAHTLYQHFNSDPREIIKKAEHDVVKLLNILQISQKKDFPYLSGPKLSNYWPFILLHYTDLQLNNPHEISIIPDTHIIQSSVKLGLVDEKADSLDVVDAWKSVLKDSGISPVEMHPVLWNWSRANFVPEIN